MTRINFNLRPSPVLAEHRRLFKISQILLILELSSRGGKSSLPRLQLFNWALKSKIRKDCLVKSAINGVLDVQAWGFDPAVAIALRFAIAESLVGNISTGYQISDIGKVFVREVMEHQNLLSDEKELLKQVGKNITEAMVDLISREWKL